MRSPRMRVMALSHAAENSFLRRRTPMNRRNARAQNCGHDHEHDHERGAITNVVTSMIRSVASVLTSVVPLIQEHLK